MSEAVELLREINPGALALARLASLAARVEPELLRALRLELDLAWDASAEADLWWSHAVETRGPTAIRFSEAALAELRAELDGTSGDVRRAREVIRRIHAGEADLLQLEESLVYESVVGENTLILQRLLGQILGTVLTQPGRVAEVSAWAIGALPRLPARVREMPLFWSVLFAVGAQGRGRARVPGLPSAQVLGEARQWLPPVLSGVGFVEIEAAWQQDLLLLRRGREVTAESEGLVVPDVDPVVLEITSDAGSAVVAVDRLVWKPVRVSGAVLGVRAIDGRSFELSPAAAPAEPAAEGDSVPPWIGILGPFPWRLWPNDSVLQVRFLDGAPGLQKRVEAVMKEWSEHANVHLRFGRDPAAQIRVSFKEAGSWSFHGTECQSVAAGKPTINFGWLTESTGDEELRRVVLHETGHVLGFVNEAQSPRARIPWDAKAVYAEYGGPPNNWSREEVDRNMLGTYAPAGPLEYREFDRESIMLHEIPGRLTRGALSTKMGSHLSDSDKAFVKQVYPPPKNAGELDASHGEVSQELPLREVHRWRLRVERGGRYGIDLICRTPASLTLFDPHGTVITREPSNEGGARIERHFEPGIWTLKVAATDPLGSGSYEMRCRAHQSRTIKEPVELYISSHPKDRKIVEELTTALAPFVKSKLLTIWHRGMLRAGEFVSEVVRREQARAGLFALVGSADALADDEVQTEWKLAVERQAVHTGRAIAILAKPALVEYSVAADLPVFPDKDSPLDGHPQRAKAIQDIVREILEMAKSETPG